MPGTPANEPTAAGLDKQLYVNPKIGRLKPAKMVAETSAARSVGMNACAACGAALQRGLVDSSCVGCGLVSAGDPSAADDGDDLAPREAAVTSRLRVVGPNSGYYQPDLDRSSGGDSAPAARRRIHEELLAYRASAIKRGAKVPPIDACSLATDMYLEIQQQVTKRKNNKQAILAACLRLACGQIGYVPETAELAGMLQLRSRGIARGDNFIRTMEADGLIEADVNQDMCAPQVSTAFCKLGLVGAEYAALRAAAVALVTRAADVGVGVSSTMRSRAHGAAFVVLNRAFKSARPAAASTAGAPSARQATAAVDVFAKELTLAEFVARCDIRKTTLERYIGPLATHHSRFADIYAAAMLRSSA